MRKTALFILLLSSMILGLKAQDTLSVLFLGNSYTAANNVPQLVHALSTAAGKTLLYDSNTPGGKTVSGHVTDQISLAKINQGNWDFVVIQEQSQIPSIDFYRYNDMYPAMTNLQTLVQTANPCSRLISFMTWGRRFGGQQCDQSNTHCSPVFVDFNHMQDSLTSAYWQISQMLNIQCAPVGVAWQNVLNDTAMVLHSGDNSHPAIEGSYLAALTLFSSIWKTNSLGNAFTAGLPPSLAQYLQTMSDSSVFQSQTNWNTFINSPTADFSFSVLGNDLSLNNTSSSALNSPLTYSWNFGDGNTSTLENPTHTYSSGGVYNVQLRVNDCQFTDSVHYAIQIQTTGLSPSLNTSVLVYPNPFSDRVDIELNAPNADYPFSISDLSGRRVRVGSFKASHNRLEMQDLAPGIYFLNVDIPENQPMRLIKR